MTWLEILPPSRQVASRGQTAAVVVTASKRHGRFVQHLTVTPRLDLIDGGLPFWRVGEQVRVYFGTGDNAGMVKIIGEAGAPHRLRRVGSRQVVNCSLCFVVPKDIVIDQQRKTPVEFEYSDDWLEITLPVSAASSAKAAGTVSGQFRTAATNGTAPRPAFGGR
jgi:hypothetical protein